MRKKIHGAWFSEPVDKTELHCCPKCSEKMTAEAVLCMSCGFNQLKAEYVVLPKRPKRRQKRSLGKREVFLFVTLSLFLTALGTGTYTYLYYESFMLKHRQNLPKSLAYKFPEQLNRPVNPRWIRDFKNETITHAFQDIVKDEMDKNYPSYTYNEEVTFELISEEERTGIFKIANEHHVLLFIGDKMVEIPLEELKSKYRIRCDIKERMSIQDKVAQDRTSIFLKASSQ